MHTYSDVWRLWHMCVCESVEVWTLVYMHTGYCECVRKKSYDPMDLYTISLFSATAVVCFRAYLSVCATSFSLSLYLSLPLSQSFSVFSCINVPALDNTCLLCCFCSSLSSPMHLDVCVRVHIPRGLTCNGNFMQQICSAVGLARCCCHWTICHSSIIQMAYFGLFRVSGRLFPSFNKLRETCVQFSTQSNRTYNHKITNGIVRAMTMSESLSQNRPQMECGIFPCVS